MLSIQRGVCTVILDNPTSISLRPLFDLPDSFRARHELAQAAIDHDVNLFDVLTQNYADNDGSGGHHGARELQQLLSGPVLKHGVSLPHPCIVLASAIY